MSIEWNGRTLVIAVLIFVGLFFEALKHVSGGHLLQQIEETVVESRPYAVSEKAIRSVTHAFAPHGPTQLAALPADVTGALEKWQKDKDKAAADDKKKKDAAKGWHWAWNSKTQKWVWKKKPKKKKAEAVAETNSDTTAPVTQPKSTATTASTASPASSLGSPQPSQPANELGGGGSATSSDKFLSAQEWESLLMGNPNAAETKYFVQQYQNHLVTAEVFYQVVNAMLKDGRSDVQQQGLLALSLTPSEQSFADLAAEQQTLQTSSPNYQTVTQDLNVYSQLKYVSVLQQVLTQSQTAVVLTAGENALQQSIQTNLNGTTGSPSAQGGTSAQAFAAFGPILTTLSSNSNATVASDAKNILSMLGATAARQASIQ